MSNDQALPERVPFNVQERDVDVSIIEELCFNHGFVSWLAKQAGVQLGAFLSVRRGVYQAGGETDVPIMFETSKGRMAVMMEDKIVATMQERQAER